MPKEKLSKTKVEISEENEKNQVAKLEARGGCGYTLTERHPPTSSTSFFLLHSFYFYLISITKTQLIFLYYFLLLTKFLIKLIFTIKENIDENFLEEQTVLLH